VRNIKSLQKEIEEYIGITELEIAQAPLWLAVDGDNFGVWSSPASVWEETISHIRKTVSSVSKYMLEKFSPEMPEELKAAILHRDFKIVGAKAGSLKIGLDFEMIPQLEFFDKPKEDYIKLGVDRILLVSKWFAHGYSMDQLFTLIPEQEEREYIVSKVVSLIPTKKSRIAYLEFSGSIIPSKSPIRLSHQQRGRIREVIKMEEGTIQTEEEGVIREIDLDKGHCILRQRIKNSEDLRCTFTKELLQQLKDGLDKKVHIIGSLNRGTISPLKIKMVEILAE
jgi:hypothetical protein